MKRRVALTLNCALLLALILTSCTGLPIPILGTPTPAIPTPTSFQQSLPPALVETDPPLGSVIGHQSPITFYFNEPVNKSSAESALTGLPAGTFTWNDDATLVFTPTQPYQPNNTLNVSLASSLQSANGFGIPAPIELSFTVADYLRATNFLPKPDAEDVNVEAAIAVSFNQPVVSLGAESPAQPSAFSIQPPVKGRGEWINTSTYIFYPSLGMTGGTEYIVSLNPELKTVTGVGLEGSERPAWKFTTSKPRVVKLEPSVMELLPLNPEIKMTFNQPMNTESVQSSFLFSGTEGALTGEFSWNEDKTEMTFVPDGLLKRNVGYILNLGATAQSMGGLILGADYGAVFNTFDNFAVSGTKTDLGSTTFTFNSPLVETNYDNLVTVTPEVDNLQAEASEDGLTLTIYGDFIPDTNYEIDLDARLRDRWGQSLGDTFALNVHAPPLPSTLNVLAYSSNVIFVRPDEAVLNANAVNIQNTNATVAPLTLQDFFALQSSYDNQQAYAPANPITYSKTFNLMPGGTTDVKIGLAQQNTQLLPGLYYVQVSSPQIQSASKNIYLVASSQVNLTFKLGATDGLVWAVDLPSQTPIANAPVTIYDKAGNPLASGTTDQDGLWKGAIPEHTDQVFAMLGQPGDENFALAVSDWRWGINAWDFGYSQQMQPPHTQIYMYTDRPIYRPGQIVYFRGVARQAFNGRYELPAANTIPLILRDTNGVQLSNFDMQLSPYGTFNGEFTLPPDAVPGYYTFENNPLNFYLSFQVAEYRKPEINLNVDFSTAEVKFGDAAQATVTARYFFDAPASDVEVHWALYAKPERFYLPNYQTGVLDTSWLDVFHAPGGLGSDYFGDLIKQGTGQTTPQGTLSIELPAIPQSEAGQIVTLEVTAQDESGEPVSARTEMHVHPADFYIGLRPDQWIGHADSAIGFEVYTVDWAQNASGEQKLSAEFKQMRWEKKTDSTGFPTYTPVTMPVSSSDLVTGSDGKARLSFVPPTAGTYMLDVSGGGAHTQTLIWVSGAGSAAWPDLPDQRFELTADRDSYSAGDNAKIFIPNPFAVNSLALVTVERGLVSKAEVVALSGSGKEYILPLTEEDAPNVYVSVTVLGQGNDFRYGLVNIPVTPESQKLNVQVSPNPAKAGPRDNVTFDVQVTDSTGQPVEGEFSLSVVDLATLALANPNSEDILPAFYSNQPLGIETGLSLAAYSGRNASQPGGLGGGGGGAPIVIREKFPDTAYWNPSLITNSEGHGQVTMTLPDSLTTWKVDVRGLTVDTRVGQAETQIVATKPLLIRPVTPRFLVSGDHVLMAAILNNNTPDPLNASVDLQGQGFTLDDPDQITQQVDIPANGRARVEWWGKAGSEKAADLVFSVTTTGTPSLQDSARPVWGQLPILQYTSPQAFVTGGVLRGATAQQEVISLPRTFSPSGGSLEVELSPSLAGSLLSALQAMDVPDYATSAESTLSYLLPNLEVYRVLNGAGLNDPALSERVTANVTTGVSRLLSLQNEDGGWSWWGKNEKSDPYISAYIFFGLLQTHEIGMNVDENALQRAGTYLSGLKLEITNDTSGAKLDEMTFIQFVLAHANTFDETTIGNLYNLRDRMSPSSKALLAYIINVVNPADERVRDLISNLEASAIVTASGVHWETPPENIFTTGSPIYTTSIVVYVLAQLDSANQVVFNAVRYLAAHENAHGLWGFGYENAWAMLALNEAMIGFGDLHADFAFHAMLNGGPLASGDVSGDQVLTPTNAQVPLEYLSSTGPNLLTVQREDGLGRLYYRAVLKVNRPVEDVKPVDAGMQIDRVYVASECRASPTGSTIRSGRDCPHLAKLQLASDKPITAQLTLVLPHDSYYVMVQDYIPAGMEILNRNLKTNQQGIDSTEVQVQFDDRDPFAEGWGWWLFHEPQIRDDGILFTADYLPAGTYVLTYTLVPVQAGEYRVLPAHAWESFFPEVQGTSAGAVFEIKP
ncbi:MAG TPA: Ig-like domain-containing protein [Anaerolineales bacterium]|nr:Ig-like domain-containing protein [Anaerolineales bacterium]